MNTRISELRKFVAPEILFGVGSSQLAGQYGRNLGGSNALIVSDPGVFSAGWVQPVLASVEAASLETVVFKRVSPNPRIEEVNTGAALYAEQGCDIIIAAGGDSLGGLLDIPHGLCNAMLLDSVIDFNYGHAEQRYRNAAAAMGLEAAGLSSGEVRNRLRAEIRRLRDAVGLGETLSQSGFHRTEVHELAGFALEDPCVVTNPRKPVQRDIEVIFEESL